MAISKFNEIGTAGMQAWSGFVEKAYVADLYWPHCYPLYNRIWRSDPEIGGIVRPALATLASDVSLSVELPDMPSDDDKKFQEFVHQVLDDLDGGQGSLLATIASYAPFFGWQWFETPLSRRKKGWSAPKDTSGWRSTYDDGLIGIRGFYHRDHSSFEKWNMDDRTGRVRGMWQNDPPSSRVMIPLDRSLHLTFGDPTSPEGLSPLEAVWRLERIKYGLEVIQGIGYEHTAGYASFKLNGQPNSDTLSLINSTARALLSAQEGNYITEVSDTFEVRIIDSAFQAAPAILEAIRYYGLLKLQMYNMQWVAMASTTNSGSFSAVQDSSSMFVSSFNAMMSGFAAQIDQQIGKRLLELNRDAFPNITRRPRIVATPIEKTIPLNELSSFIRDTAGFLPLGDDDIIAIRRKSGFLPETLPDVNNDPMVEEEETAVVEDELADNRQEEERGNLAELADTDDLFTDRAKQIANDFADAANEDMKEIYEQWVQETAAKLQAADEDERDEILAAALLILIERVTRMLARISGLMANTLDLDEEQRAALDGVTAETIAYFEENTIPRLRKKGVDAEDDFEDNMTGEGRNIALIGGVLWAAYVAAKLAGQPATQMARWDGPDDSSTCAPCSEQMRLGERPLSQIPLPGIGVCLGLSNCRHDIILV